MKVAIAYIGKFKTSNDYMYFTKYVCDPALERKHNYLHLKEIIQSFDSLQSSWNFEFIMIRPCTISNCEPKVLAISENEVKNLEKLCEDSSLYKVKHVPYMVVEGSI